MNEKYWTSSMYKNISKIKIYNLVQVPNFHGNDGKGAPPLWMCLGPRTIRIRPCTRVPVRAGSVSLEYHLSKSTEYNNNNNNVSIFVNIICDNSNRFVRHQGGDQWSMIIAPAYPFSVSRVSSFIQIGRISSFLSHFPSTPVRLHLPLELQSF